MKAVIAVLILGASIAQASVDYVAIGKIVTAGKKDTEDAKQGVACLMKSYADSPSCEKIENINEQTNKLLNSANSFEYMMVSNCGQFMTVVASGIMYFEHKYSKAAKELAKDAPANDPVHGVIQKMIDAHQQMVDETTDVLAKAKLQETYVTKCLLGQEPTSTTILEQLCK